MMSGSDGSVHSSLARIMADIAEQRSRRAGAMGVSVAELDAIEAAERDAATRAEEARSVRKSRERIVELYGARIPAKAVDAFLSGQVADTEAVLAVRSWLASDKAYCILIGGTGVGKTMASLVALGEVGGVFVRSPDLGPAIEPWKADLERGVQSFDAGEPSLVVLDDLGVERREDTRWVTSFDELIDARQGRRFGKQLRTLITSNLTPEDIAERYSERARDRIRASRFVKTLASKSMRGEP